MYPQISIYPLCIPPRSKLNPMPVPLNKKLCLNFNQASKKQKKIAYPLKLVYTINRFHNYISFSQSSNNTCCPPIPATPSCPRRCLRLPLTRPPRRPRPPPCNESRLTSSRRRLPPHPPNAYSTIRKWKKENGNSYRKDGLVIKEGISLKH